MAKAKTTKKKEAEEPKVTVEPVQQEQVPTETEQAANAEEPLSEIPAEEIKKETPDQEPEVEEKSEEVHETIKEEQMIVSDNEGNLSAQLIPVPEPESTPVETVSEKKALSPQAENWKKYLDYMKITPETWLAKYPNHKFKHLVQEIVDQNAQK